MRVFLLALFVAVAVAAPTPEDDGGEPVELIVEGLAEGEPLEIGDILNVKVKKHVDGVIASVSDLLFPLTAQGLAEAEANQPQEPEQKPEELPEVSPEEEPEEESGSVVLPAPPLPEVVPNPDPEVEQPEIDLNPVEPVPPPQLPIGEVFNDGIVQVKVNANPGLLSSVQSWFNMVLNYFNGDVQTTHQIV